MNLGCLLKNGCLAIQKILLNSQGCIDLSIKALTLAFISVSYNGMHAS